MKRGIQLILYTVLAAIVAASLCFAAESLWVTSEQADLKAERSISSETIAELERGTELTVEAYESRWYQVRTADEQVGWVYRGKVSEEKPETADSQKGEGGGLGGLLGGLSGSSVEADAADSARSIRGLSPEAKAYADKTGTPEQSRQALDQVLSRSITEAEITALLKSGNVGEYAE